MSNTNGVADLHTHTLASDGTISVEQRAAIAAERGIETVAITDHDIVADRLQEPTMMIDGVEIVTGVEVRARIFDTKIEILGYFLDPSEPALTDLLKRSREFRQERNRQLVENVSAVTDLELSYETLAADVEGNLGRPHLADLLITNRVVDSIGEAFDEFLAEDGAAFVPMEQHSYDAVIEAIHQAGGVCSLAHPGRIRTNAESVEGMVEQLAEAGLDAIEVWYPYSSERSSQYADVTVEGVATLADRHGLLKTGGSDCHGLDSGKFRMGDLLVSADTVASLRERSTTRIR